MFLRVITFCAVLFLAWFGLKHLWTGTLVWPRMGSNRAPPPWHGWPVVLLSFASLCGAANLLVNALFRTMTKERERRWILFARAIAFLGWLLFLSSFALALWRF